MNRDQMVKSVAAVTAIANAKFPGLKMRTPNVTFYSKGTAAGWAKYKDHEVSFNEVLAAENPASFHDVICHEVGHLATNKMFNTGKYRPKPHGEEFKMVVRALGGTGTRTHKFNTSSVSNRRRHEAKCACNTHYVSTREANRIETRRCVKCKGDLTLTGKVVVK